jgi:hypothetical protein
MNKLGNTPLFDFPKAWIRKDYAYLGSGLEHDYYFCYHITDLIYIVNPPYYHYVRMNIYYYGAGYDYIMFAIEKAKRLMVLK